MAQPDRLGVPDDSDSRLSPPWEYFAALAARGVDGRAGCDVAGGGGEGVEGQFADAPSGVLTDCQ